MERFEQEHVSSVVLFRCKAGGPLHRGVVEKINRFGHAEVVWLRKDGTLVERRSWTAPDLAEIEP